MLRYLSLLPLLFLLACMPVRVDYDHRVDFNRYKTYAWRAPMPEADWEKLLREDLMVRRVAEQLDGALAARGYRKAEGGDPDFLVSFKPLLRSRWVLDHQMIGRLGHGYADFRRLPGAGIQVDFLEAGSRRVVWTGSAGRGLEGDLTPQQAERLVADTLAALIQRFPPAAR